MLGRRAGARRERRGRGARLSVRRRLRRVPRVLCSRSKRHGQLDFGLLRRVHRLLVRHGRVRLDGHAVVDHVRRRRLRGPRRGDAGLPGDPDARQRHRRDRLPHGVLCRVRLDGDRRRGNLPRPPDLVDALPGGRYRLCRHGKARAARLGLRPLRQDRADLGGDDPARRCDCGADDAAGASGDHSVRTCAPRGSMMRVFRS
mmetsp:Transcript_6190/g.17670  ORF Transcript_6190/g.17670 Transcript_6190/m.17670 type:complete len:201 (+) Transcript_6190:1294-1896(+)